MKYLQIFCGLEGVWKDIWDSVTLFANRCNINRLIAA
jgi:hypothetical protein